VQSGTPLYCLYDEFDGVAAKMQVIENHVSVLEGHLKDERLDAVRTLWPWSQ
jgi:hypothetical protein